MNRIRWSALLVLTLLIVRSNVPAKAQMDKISIPAGTPEDRALQAITNETDNQKRTAMLQDFVQKFASNPAAVAYGNWQLAQTSLSGGNAAAALIYGDKALVASPRNLDILVSQTGVAQQLKDWGKVVGYAVRGGEIYNSIGKQPNPSNTMNKDFEATVTQEKEAAKPSYEFLEAAGFNAITAEQNPKQRMNFIERFTPAFPGSKFEEQVAQYAMYTLQQLNDSPRLVSYGEKALAANKEEPGAYSTALYRLGYSYAKLGRLTEARQVLSEALKINGPFQQPARDLLTKVNSARAKGK